MRFEVWRDVPGYEGAYQVSDQGRVRSLPGGSRHGKVLRQGTAGKGYPSVSLCKGSGRGVNTYVHHLVAAAFIGPRPDGLDVCHNNGDQRDNRVANLRYDTVTANIRDAVTQGRHQEAARGVCDHGHPLTEANVYVESAGTAADGSPKFRRRCRICRARDAHQTYIRRRDRLVA